MGCLIRKLPGTNRRRPYLIKGPDDSATRPKFVGAYLLFQDVVRTCGVRYFSGSRYLLGSGTVFSAVLSTCTPDRMVSPGLKAVIANRPPDLSGRVTMLALVFAGPAT